MRATRQADTCTLKGAILSLAKEHAEWLGFTLDTGLKKDQRGINNPVTARLFLPNRYATDYHSDPRGKATFTVNTLTCFFTHPS